jgi:hypothetical protein
METRALMRRRRRALTLVTERDHRRCRDELISLAIARRALLLVAPDDFQLEGAERDVGAARVEMEASRGGEGGAVGCEAQR